MLSEQELACYDTMEKIDAAVEYRELIRKDCVGWLYKAVLADEIHQLWQKAEKMHKDRLKQQTGNEISQPILPHKEHNQVAAELEKANEKLAKLQAMCEEYFDGWHLTDDAYDMGRREVMSQVLRYLEIER